MNPERILIVGLGSIGQRHCRLIRARHPEADLRVLRHQVTDAAAAEGKLAGANGVFFALDQALAFRPQVAVVANPAPFHLPVVQALVAIGCHVLVEKPLAVELAGVADCLDQARRHGVKVQVGYNLRFLPSLQEFCRRIQAGEVGQVFSVRCEIGQFLPSWRPGTDFRQGVSARPELGGGVLLELSHELDYLRWIFGEIAWVNAWLGRLSGLGLAVEDTAHLTLGFGDQAVGALSLDFARHDTTRTCTAIGTTGTLNWNALTGTVSRFSPETATWETVFEHRAGRDETYLAQWQAFLHCVETGEDPQVSGEDGLAVLNLIAAARRSAECAGQRVRVDKLVNEWGGKWAAHDTVTGEKM